MPARRFKSEGWWEYQEYKNNLAQEIQLNLLADVKGGKVCITEKWARFEQRPNRRTRQLETVPTFPTTRLVKIRANFERKGNLHADIDNLLKMALDVLQTAGVLYNDDQVREISAKVKKGVPEGNFSLDLAFIE